MSAAEAEPAIIGWLIHLFGNWTDGRDDKPKALTAKNP